MTVNGNPPANTLEAQVRIYSADNDDPATTNAADSAELADLIAGTGAGQDTQLQTIVGIKVNGIALNIDTNLGDGLHTLSTTSGGRTWTTTPDANGGYLITRLDVNDQVLIEASGVGYSRIEIENPLSLDASPNPSLDGDTYDIGGLSYVTTVTNVPSVELNFDVALTDADGDSSISSLAIDLLSSGVATTDNSSAGEGVIQTAGGGVQNIVGSNFVDQLTGDSAANVLAGLDGADTLSGAGGNDSLIGGTGNDSLTGGAGADTLSGGGGADTFVYNSGDTAVLIGGSGDAGTVSGYDKVTDFDSAVDKINLVGAPFAAANTIGVSGTDSILTIGGQTVKSHAISNGVITFDDANTFVSPLTLTSTADVAAVVQYLRANNIGAAGATVAFTATVSGVAHTFVYQQVGAAASVTNDILIDLNGITIANLSTLISTNVIDPIILDLDGNGFAFSDVSDGASFDINADGRVDRVAWNTSGDGILAMDIDHDGAIDDGSEIFTPNFGGGSFDSGADALASLDSDGDGVVDMDDEAFANLLIWQDADADGVSDEGELSSLADHGITGISAPSNPASGEIDGQTVIGEGTFTREDGTIGTYVEVALESALGTAEQSNEHEPQTFVVDDLSMVELIPDYSFGDGDQIDLSALLDGNFRPGGDRVSDFVRLQANGDDLTLQVDVDGTAESHGWTDAATLPGLAGVSAAIKVVFSDDTEKTVTI